MAHFQFFLKLAESEHEIVEARIREECDKRGFSFALYEKFQPHRPTYRLCGIRQTNHDDAVAFLRSIDIEPEFPPYWPPEGHYTLKQYFYVFDLLRDKHERFLSGDDVPVVNALETGFYTGRSALAVLNSCPSLKNFISVDRNFSFHSIGQGMRALLAEKFRYFDSIEADSKELFTDEFFKDNYGDGIDFASVDGEHTYQGCLSDLRKIYPHMNKGGIITIDDYRAHPPDGIPMPSVIRACDDFYSEHQDGLEKSEWDGDGKGLCIFMKK